MSNTKEEIESKVIRRTISLSPAIDEMLRLKANNEFGGNISAYIAHALLVARQCGDCSLIKEQINMNFGMQKSGIVNKKQQ